MSKELLDVISAVSHQKDIDKSVIIEAMEEALRVATLKIHGPHLDVRVVIDPETGVYETFRRWTVLAEDAEITNSEAEIGLIEARREDQNLQAGDVLEDVVPSIEFGRIAARAAEMIIIQKLKEAERGKMIARLLQNPSRLVSGMVRKVTRELLIVDLAGLEGIMYREDWLPRDTYRVGDRVKACIKEVMNDHRGSRLLLSRNSNEMLIELFKQQVPEVAEEVIHIKAVARDAGSRAKVAVKTNDGRIDPVGACVGMKGSRVQAISDELGGERVDVIPWHDSPAQFVINAMAPAEVLSIVVDEERHSMDVAVSEKQLSLAIGRGGQNVRLANQLTGWSLNVMSDEQAVSKREGDVKATTEFFAKHLEVDEDVAALLVEGGFTTLEEIAHVAAEEMLDIEGFDAEIVGELQERAKNLLLTQALTGKTIAPAEDLLDMQGMDRALAYALAEKGIVTMEDLAEQSIDDIIGIQDLDTVRAGELIMTARAPWFK